MGCRGKWWERKLRRTWPTASMGRSLDLDCRQPESLMGFEDGSGMILSMF